MNYYETLPKNYFRNLVPKVISKVHSGENVLVSTLYGGGGKTFLNLFYLAIGSSTIMEEVYTYDPEINSETLVKFVSQHSKNKKNKKLIIVRSFEKLPNKRDLFDKLTSYRLPNQANLVFLFITDHTAITNPSDYFGHATSFFSAHYYIEPFDLPETKDLVNNLNTYYGWTVSENDVPEIISLSGGNPRLIKHTCQALSEKELSIGNHEKLLSVPAIIFEISYLSELIITLSQRDLAKLGLVSDSYEIKSSLVRRELHDFKSDEVETFFPDLSESELKLLSFLKVAQGKIISLEKIEDLLTMSGWATTQWAIYKTLSRLRKKITSPFEILNVKGKGYLLRHKSNS